jgi:RNA polymerase sigma factor (sigma-70 family)
MPVAQIDKLIGHLFRTESGKMVSVLTRMLGLSNYEAAEDIVQETLLKAVNVWKYKGIPENPSAWLYAVAKRKAIDLIRQQKIREGIHEDMARALKSEWTLAPTVNQLFLENEIEDSQLRMIFACCHPSIPYGSQLALTLKTLCGLSVAEIAKAFLTNDETINKRIYRAREKIREENIDMDVPVGRALTERLEAVWHTLYLLFNEGYHSSHPELLIRQELCAEAMRLCLLLTRNPIAAAPTSSALLALMCFQASRESSRLSLTGEIILLKDQNRDLWDRGLIEKGLEYLAVASVDGDVSGYHIEAAIGALHATSVSVYKTDWKRIAQLYESLERFRPGPITKLNSAIALGYASSRIEGLNALLQIDGLENNHLYHAAVGEFYSDLKQNKNAAVAFRKAIQLSTSEKEKSLFQKKLAQL